MTLTLMLALPVVIYLSLCRLPRAAVLRSSMGV